MMQGDEAQQLRVAEHRARFLESADGLRSRLHGYCTRLLASPLDAEDVVQEVLAQAFFKSPILERPDEIENWLFRVAYNRSMDVLRRRLVRRRLAPLASPSTAARPVDRVEAGQLTEEAFGHLVRLLAPRERTCLVLKDVLDYSLRETADLLETTEGAVKAALHRARAKLQEASTFEGESSSNDTEVDEETLRLVSAYAERFNARDWDGLVSLLQADARLEVLEVFDGSGPAAFEQLYFRNYSKLTVSWTVRPAVVAGEAALVIEREVEGELWLYSVVRIRFEDSQIAAIRDYLHVPDYLLASVARWIGGPPPAPFDWGHLDPAARP